MTASFEIKSAQLNLVALQLKSGDWQVIARELLEKFGPGTEGEKFFHSDPLVLDFDTLPIGTGFKDYAVLLSTLRQCNLLPVAVRSQHAQWLEFGLKQGLAEAARYTQKREEVAKKASIVAPVAIVPAATLVLDKPVRGGQKIYAKGCDLIALQVVNSGAELIADGNIHVYGPLRGRVLAGANGNVTARIFAQQFEPELVSIAGIYKTNENAFEKDIDGKAAQVYLKNDGSEHLVIEAIKI